MLERVYSVGVNTDVQNPLTGFDSLSKVFGVAMNVVMGVAVSLAVIFLGLGGIQYITAKGDAKAADAARTSITNAVIGLVIAIGAVVIKTIVFNILGASDPATGGNVIIVTQ